MNNELRTILVNLELGYRTHDWNVIDHQITRVAYLLADLPTKEAEL